MNTYGMVLVGLFLLGGVAVSQEIQTDQMPMRRGTMPITNPQMTEDCVMMRDGKMVVIKDGERMPMDEDIVMPNGTLVMKDGTCVMLYGVKRVMREGEQMDMEGNMIKSGHKNKK